MESKPPFGTGHSSVKTEVLAAEGAIAASSASECVSASQIVLVCVIDPAAYNDIFERVDPASCNGCILVDYTSGSPSQIRHSYEIASNQALTQLRARRRHGVPDIRWPP